MCSGKRGSLGYSISIACGNSIFNFHGALSKDSPTNFTTAPKRPVKQREQLTYL